MVRVLVIVVAAGPAGAGKYGEDLCDLPNTTMQNLFQFLSGMQDQVCQWVGFTILKSIQADI